MKLEISLNTLLLQISIVQGLILKFSGEHIFHWDPHPTTKWFWCFRPNSNVIFQKQQISIFHTIKI